MPESLYRVAREVTDDVLGPGAYAAINRGNRHPLVQEQVRASERGESMSDVEGEPFALNYEERDAVRHILAEIERRGYDDTALNPVVRELQERLRERWHADRDAAA